MLLFFVALMLVMLICSIFWFSHFPDFLSKMLDIDAKSIKGERYAIKSTSTNLTDVFNSLPIKDEKVVYFE